MSKFDIDLPEWAKYVAQDRDGSWYCYSGKPTLTVRGTWMDDGGRYDAVTRYGKRPKDFTKELYKVIWK